MFSPLTAVHVANVLAYEQHPDASKLVGPQLDLGYLKELGLEDRLAAWRDAVFETSSGHEQPKTRDQKPPSKPEKPVKANPQPVAPKSPPPPTPASKSRWLVPVFSSLALLCVIWLFWQRINTLILGVPDEPVPPSKSRPAKSLGVRAMPVQAREPDTNAARQLPRSLAPPETNLASTLPPAKPPFPVLKLQGIFYREDKPCVMINGLTHYKGDKISGAEITAIDRETVTLTYQGETRILKVR
jgi:hypothetical protein